MKILMPSIPYTSCGYPQTPGKQTGGAERVFIDIAKSLKKQGHEVTLFTDENFLVARNSGVKQKKGLFKSKAQTGRCPTKAWTTGFIQEFLSGEYDRVILNFSTFYLKGEVLNQFRSICPKLSLINHVYDEVIDSSFMCTQLQSAMEVIEHGGKFFSTSNTLIRYLQKKYPQNIIQGNPYFSDELTRVLYLDKVLFFENGVSSYDDSKLLSTGDYIFIGRCAKEKKPVEAVKAFIQSGKKEKLRVFVSRYSAAEDSYWDTLETLCNSVSNIELSVSPKREVILKALAKSSILLFPSIKETFGLVPLEAASFGVRVIHKDEHCSSYSDYDYLVSDSSVSTLKKAIISCPVPSLEEKLARAEEISTKFTEERFDKVVRELLG